MQKEQWIRTLDRRLAFHEGRLGEGVLADISIAPLATEGPPPSPPPARVRGCLAIEEPERHLANNSRWATGEADNPSDVLVCVYPTLPFGESLWSGLMGGEILFSGTDNATWSHCPEPPVKDLAAFEFPPLDETNRWYRAAVEITKLFAERLPPLCDVTPFIFLDCMNLLVELRGAANAYLDLYDHPDLVSRFMDWSVEVNEQFYEAQATLLRPFVNKVFGDHPYAAMSAACIPMMSVDAYGMCSVETYRTTGLEQHRRIVARHGGGSLHLHGNGRHLCEAVASIEGLSSCHMGDDVGYPPAWTIAGELKARMAPVPISLVIPREAFVEKLRDGSLPRGIQYSLTARSREEAEQIMSEVLALEGRQG